MFSVGCLGENGVNSGVNSVISGVFHGIHDLARWAGWRVGLAGLLRWLAGPAGWAGWPSPGLVGPASREYSCVWGVSWDTWARCLG